MRILLTGATAGYIFNGSEANTKIPMTALMQMDIKDSVLLC